MKDRLPNRERRKSDGQGWIEKEWRKQVFVLIYLFQRKLPKRRELLAKSIPHQIHIHYFQLFKKNCSFHSYTEWLMAWNLFFRDENNFFPLSLKLLLLLLLFP